MHSGTKNLSSRRWATVILFIPALIQIFPLFYLLCIAFKGEAEVIRYPPKLLPEHLNLSNFQTAFETAPLFRFLINSAIVSFFIMLLQVTTSIFAAFALARINFWGQKIILGLILATMLIPGEATLVSNYFTLASLNLLDTYSSLILPFAASGFGIFLLYQFFRSIPKELEEAARVDGCSRLRFLFQIVIPLSLPAIFAFGIYSFVGAWNQYLWPLIVTQSTNMQTAQIALGIFRAQNESMSWAVIMAATAILMAPILIIFIFAQRKFVQGITMSGLKG